MSPCGTCCITHLKRALARHAVALFGDKLDFNKKQMVASEPYWQDNSRGPHYISAFQGLVPLQQNTLMDPFIVYGFDWVVYIVPQGRFSLGPFITPVYATCSLNIACYRKVEDSFTAFVVIHEACYPHVLIQTNRGRVKAK
ncbi:hypothetical protein VNO77_22547 [Canavalia gladiata]|uniref:Uncharacterized protein n=1 Tax=Canavalia gladiata TaxID=3824 RepID=A0AAN9L3R3_CANGL